MKCSASKARPKNGIRYITNPKKAEIVSVRNLFEDEDYAKQFEETARRFCKGEKYEERKYYHFKVSCARQDNLGAEWAHKFAEEVAEKLLKDCEYVIATHTDTKTVHSHIIVNAVDPITGRKLQFRNKDYVAMKDEVNRIGKAHGYYDLYGKELHLYGRYTHKEKLGILTEEEKEDFERIKKTVPREVFDDFIGRREKNLAVIMHNLEYIKNGTVDYFIVPQDDAAVYGFTSMDQMTVREFLKTNSLHLKTAMYPSADDTGLILLGRAVVKLNNAVPKIFVKYASSKAGAVIPWFEDRALDETIKYHIMAAGGQRVYSLLEADILLAVNQGSGMWYPDQPEYVTAYDIERNLGEFVSYMEYALEKGKIVAVGDVAYCNGGDEELVRLMNEEKLMLKVHAYAGWNTSSNTLGTAVCEAVLYLLGKDETGNESFLLHRYYEDIGYMPFVKKYVTDTYLPKMGLDYFHTDGKAGKVAEIVKEEIDKRMKTYYPSVYGRVETLHVEMPWSRMFEVDVKLTVKKAERKC